MTIQDLKIQNLLLLECISGSKAYGLEVPTSDTDIKGVFLLPKAEFYGSNYIPQIANETNDIVYYELGRFIELLGKNNPSMLELLATPDDKILYRHELIHRIDLNLFLSKKCKDTFGGYAFTQVRKSRGLNKKIVNPMTETKKTILEFCYVLHQQGSISLAKWLEKNNYSQEQIGLINIPHAKDMYGIFYDENEELSYKGILKKENATSVLLSSIPKEEQTIGYLYFNQDGYIKYCKDHREYWDWVAKRNEDRYQNNLEHGKNYDSKNMMHTFRLLDMAIEILEQGKVIVQRQNREELLAIRKGEWTYEELIAKAEVKMKQVEMAYQKSTLPEEPNPTKIKDLLIELRTAFYE